MHICGVQDWMFLHTLAARYNYIVFFVNPLTAKIRRTFYIQYKHKDWENQKSGQCTDGLMISNKGELLPRGLFSVSANYMQRLHQNVFP